MAESTYRVKWEIDVSARCPEAAALKALAILQDKDSTAVIFDVTGGDIGKKKVSVDLDEYAICDSCGFLSKVPDNNDFAEITDLLKRIGPGGMVPICECPRCMEHALAYPAKKMLDEMGDDS